MLEGLEALDSVLRRRYKTWGFTTQTFDKNESVRDEQSFENMCDYIEEKAKKTVADRFAKTAGNLQRRVARLEETLLGK